MKKRNKSKYNPLFAFAFFCGGIVFLAAFISSCGQHTEHTHTNVPTNHDTLAKLYFPDSTNLLTAADSLRFAELCIFYHDRNDIAERYFLGIVKGWNQADTCDEVVCNTFSWLACEAKRKPVIDTALVLQYFDSSHRACPADYHHHVVHGSTLLELNLPGAENHFNEAMKKGASLWNVSEYVNSYLDQLDTTKLNFQRMRPEEMIGVC